MLAPEIFRMIFGLAAVIGMIGVSAFLARKAGLSTFAGAAGRKRRLAISEVLPLDARRRLAIVRCDDLEYLIVLGAAGETVVAAGLEVAPELEESEQAPAAVNPFADLGGFAKKIRDARSTLTNRNAA